MYSNEVKGAPQNPDLLLRSYMVGRVLLRPSPPTIQHIYTYQIKKSVQPTGYDAVDSVSDLMNTHPRLAGVQINIEPMPDGNADFLTLLDELRATIPGKILSVAAYPPPTTWHRFPDVHWSLEYLCKVANRCDQMAEMMYDTSIQLEKVYIDLTTRWTAQLTETLRSIDCDLLLGIPAYEDADVGYHHPRVENIISALRGVSAADPGQDIRGIAVYCEWEMNETKWREWRRMIPGCIND